MDVKVFAEQGDTDGTWYSTLTKVVSLLRENGFTVEPFPATRFGYSVTNRFGGKRSFVSVIELIIFAREVLPEVHQIKEDEPDELEKYLMAEFAITFNGEQYEYSEYRYDRLADAINYAILERSKAPRVNEAISQPRRMKLEAPNDEEKALMRKFNVTNEGRYYHYKEYRYQRLADAISYAELELSRKN